MERSRNRTPIIQRSKGACSIGLVVALGCAVFGVGGAAAGDGSYARHVREARLEARLAGATLAHRTPEQLVLAITPKHRHRPAAVASAPAAPAAAAPAPAPAPAPAATATQTATTTQASTPAPAPATTQADTVQPATPAVTPTVNADANGATANAAAGVTGADGGTTGTSPTDTTPTTTDTTTTGTTTTGTTTTGTTTTGTTTTGTTTTGTTTTGTTTTGTTTTGTTTTGTTTTGTTTTGTTTTGTTTTGTTTTGTTTTGGYGRPGDSSSSGASSTPTACHGRCNPSQGTGALPSSLPSGSSQGTSGGFSLTVSPSTTTTTPAAVPTTPVTAVSSETLTPTIPAAPTPSLPTTPSIGATQLNIPLAHIPTFVSSSALRRVSKGTTKNSTGASLGTAGTGAAAARTVTAAPATGGTAVAAVTPARTASAKTATHHKAPARGSSGGSGLPAEFTAPVIRLVGFIPTAVWIALGAAFGLALAFAGIALRSSRRARQREREFVAISAAAATDALTGILNRRGFMDAAERELARASRYDRPFVLAYVDVRGLKAVNDTEGHLVGDELIQAVAGLMKESARADDVVGRIGGDEFALLLDEQTAEGAQPVLRRIRARVDERRAAMEIRVPWELTIGIASFPNDGSTLEELLGTADRRLYEQRGIALR